jgi:hypothetical protein
LFVHRHRRERCVVKCAESVRGRASTGVHMGLGLLSARRYGRTLGTLSDEFPGISNGRAAGSTWSSSVDAKAIFVLESGSAGSPFFISGLGGPAVDPNILPLHMHRWIGTGALYVCCTGCAHTLQWHERHVVKSEEWATTLPWTLRNHTLLIAQIVDWPTNSTPFPTSLGDCSSLSGHT